LQRFSSIGWFADIGLADRPSVGGKGGSLGELARAGISVPPGFVVRTAAFERFLEALERERPVRAAVAALDPDDLAAIATCSGALRARVEGAVLPDDIRDAILAAYEELVRGVPDAAVAVRSSATTEDSEDASFAGLQDTYLWTKGAAETLRKVQSCWASLYSVPSIAYRRKHDLPEAGVAMGVVVQLMVDARSAGVMFTRSPTTGDRTVVTIESSWGLGSAIVGGEVTPDRFVISKITDEIAARDVSLKLAQHLPADEGGVRDAAVPEAMQRAPSLSDSELVELVAIAKRVERHYGRPQDIEWAIARHASGTDAIFLLQSRPETVWAARDGAPVAKPAVRPMDHVLNIFGGRR